MSSTKSRKEIITDKLYYPIRIAILLSVVFLFIPNLNPARISGMINKNMSLFSAGISYSSLTAEFGRGPSGKDGWRKAPCSCYSCHPWPCVLGSLLFV